MPTSPKTSSGSLPLAKIIERVIFVPSKLRVSFFFFFFFSVEFASLISFVIRKDGFFEIPNGSSSICCLCFSC